MSLRSITVAIAAGWLAIIAAPVAALRATPLSAAPPSACDSRIKPAKLSFTLKDQSGRSVKLVDFKGQVIVLNFWATWCAPCKVEIPALIELQTKYGSGGLQVLGVSVDDPLDKLRPFVDTLAINYPVLQGRGHGELLDAYAPVPAIPATVVIGRDGNICARHSGVAPIDELERQIQSLL